MIDIECVEDEIGIVLRIALEQLGEYFPHGIPMDNSSWRGFFETSVHGFDFLLGEVSLGEQLRHI